MKPFPFVIVQRTSLHEGEHHLAEKIATDKGTFYFLKTLKKPNQHFFQAEKLGLRTLNSSGLKTPDVIYQDDQHLVLEWIELQSPNESFWRVAGQTLARFHKNNQLLRGGLLGFNQDNFIGITPQKNTPQRPFNNMTDWVQFFFEERLLYQAQLLLEKNLEAEDIYERLITLRPQIESALCSADELPCLLHGDLWSGNLLCGPGLEPIFIDPACYFGHREVELSLCRLFGGFHFAFFEAYLQAHPLSSGWQQREKFYQLYHLLNHWNIFGSSYRDACKKILSLKDH